MTKNKHCGRKTAQIVRLPATKSPRLQKKLKIAKLPSKMK
jgi:hypothetical protein